MKLRDRLWANAARQKVPITLAFELLPICNLKCKMCYVRKTKEEVENAGGLISGAKWLEWIKQAGDEGLLFPLLTGGEPLLHPDFWEIYDGMYEMGMQISMNTNGILITQEVAKRFAKSLPTRINITLYGASEETYQKLCNNGKAFYKVKDAVKWLKFYGVPLKFNMSVTPENEHDLEKIIQFAKQQDVPLQVATYMFPPVRRNENMIGENERLNPEDAGRLRVKADYLYDDSQLFIAKANSFRKFIPLDELQFQNNGTPMHVKCRSGSCSAWLDWQGNLRNCGVSSSVSISLKEKSLHQAWNEIVEFTKQFTYMPRCASCPNLTICRPCLATVKDECGDLNGKPEYLCKMNEASAIYYKKYIPR